MGNSEPNQQTSGKSYRLNHAVIQARPLEPALYLVSTPIGNLGDITLRALETLAGADVIACEDTRVSRVLLDRYGIRTRPYAYHEYNAVEVGAKLLEALEAGKSVALISDAGTPMVADPGFRLGRLVIDAGHSVVPIPGASAPLAALVASGLSNESFFFAGFLPSRDHGRRERLNELKSVPATLIFFESPHRIGATLASAAAVFGTDRQAAVCRELTKTFEEFRRGTLGELSAQLPADASVRGEIVLVIGPPPAVAPPGDEEIDDLLKRLLSEMQIASAASEAARLTGLKRKELYTRLLAIKDAHKKQADGEG